MQEPKILSYKNVYEWPFKYQVEAYLQESIQKAYQSSQQKKREVRYRFGHSDEIASTDQVQIGFQVAKFKFKEYLRFNQDYKVEKALQLKIFGHSTKFFQSIWKQVFKQAKTLAKIAEITQMVNMYVYQGKGDLGMLYKLYFQLDPQICISEIQGLPSVIIQQQKDLKDKRRGLTVPTKLSQKKNLTINQLISKQRILRFNYLKRILQFKTTYKLSQKYCPGINNYFEPSQIPLKRDKKIMKVVSTFFPFITPELFRFYSSTYFTPQLNVDAANQKSLPFCTAFASGKVIRSICQRLNAIGYCKEQDEYFQAVALMNFPNQIILKQGNQIFRIIDKCLYEMRRSYKLKLEQLEQQRLKREKKSVSNIKESKIPLDQQFNVNWLCVKQRRQITKRWGLNMKQQKEYERDQTYIKQLLRLGHPLIASIICTQVEFQAINNRMMKNMIVPADQVKPDSPNQSSQKTGHAVVIAGYDDFWNVYYILNSWGDAVGAEGFHAFQVGFPFKEVYHLYDQKRDKGHPQRYQDKDAEKDMERINQICDLKDSRIQQRKEEETVKRSISGPKLPCTLRKSSSSSTNISLSKSTIIEEQPKTSNKIKDK